MRLRVNGVVHRLSISGHETLLAVLRERLQLTGTKLVCGRGECGACTVLLAAPGAEAEPAYACLTLAAACDGSAVTTIEGLAGPDAEAGGAAGLHPVQRAFIERDALQCGFCTPGQVLAAVALLRRSPAPSRAEVVRWMSGNLCRCGAYPKIVEAVLDAAGAGSASAGEGGRDGG
jgi:xanthine dehydrogenase YagT iron-sulfur-binding subunit